MRDELWDFMSFECKQDKVNSWITFLKQVSNYGSYTRSEQRHTIFLFVCVFFFSILLSLTLKIFLFLLADHQSSLWEIRSQRN
jgi:hypothetical protein